MEKLAELFENGDNQAVCLPEEFRLDGKSVRISRLGNGLFLESVDVQTVRPDILAWFAAMDANGPLEIQREQSLTIDREIFD